MEEIKRRKKQEIERKGEVEKEEKREGRRKRGNKENNKAQQANDVSSRMQCSAMQSLISLT